MNLWLGLLFLVLLSGCLQPKEIPPVVPPIREVTFVPIDPPDQICSIDSDCVIVQNDCSCGCGSSVNKQSFGKYSICENYQGARCALACPPNVQAYCNQGVCAIRSSQPTTQTDSNTLYHYSARVGIDSTSFSLIEQRLTNNGCEPLPQTTRGPSCYFGRISRDGQNVIRIYPEGAAGFGSISFDVSEDTLYAAKDVRGPQSEELFKQAVRDDLALVGNVVTIREDAWVVDGVTEVTWVY